MSVEELKFITIQGCEIKVSNNDKEFEFEIDNGETYYYWLDHNQAYVLMLYLKEHINYDKTDKSVKDIMK